MDIKDFSLEIEAQVDSYLIEGGSRQQAFTLYVMNEMQEKANLGEICACYDRSVASNKREGIINGFAISLAESEDADGRKLTLFGTIYKPSENGTPQTVRADEFQKVATKLQNYYINATKNIHYEMPRHTDKYRVCEFIGDHQNRISTVQFVIISNCLLPNCKMPPVKIEGRTVTFSTWDISQLFNSIYSETERIDIVIDFENDELYKDFKLPFVKMNTNEDNYDAYVGIVPGEFLRQLYEVHNIDLLQSNLRYFKGNTEINKGMFETVLNEPFRFLAYNNGLTTIASNVVFNSKDGTNGYISCLTGFQIVNGGQTTASLYTVKKNNPSADLSQVFVQMKLIVAKNDVNEMLPKVTKFSNSQNKVPNSDFSSNSQFCIDLFEMSKVVYAPDPNGLGNPTLWYFNKFSKQYNRELENIREPEKKAVFKKRRPENQIFDKILVSKAYNSWNLMPYAVAKGGQYCFKTFINTFVETKKKTDALKVDRIFYEDLIAQIIIFNYLEKKSPAFASFRDHRSLVIPYTLSMLNYLTQSKFSLYSIWKKQIIPDNLAEFLDDLGQQVYSKLKEKVPQGQSFRTYCGVQKNWDKLREEPFNLTKLVLIKDLMKASNEDAERLESLQCTVSDEDRERVIKPGAKFWAGLMSYHEQFPPKASDKMSEIFQSLSSNRIPNDQLIERGLHYLSIVEELGLTVDEVKSRSSIKDEALDISIVSKKTRIEKALSTDAAIIEGLAERCIDKSKCKILWSFINTKKKHSINDYNIVCEILDTINRRFNRNY